MIWATQIYVHSDHTAYLHLHVHVHVCIYRSVFRLHRPYIVIVAITALLVAAAFKREPSV